MGCSIQRRLETHPVRWDTAKSILTNRQRRIKLLIFSCYGFVLSLSLGLDSPFTKNNFSVIPLLLLPRMSGSFSFIIQSHSKANLSILSAYHRAGLILS